MSSPVNNSARHRPSSEANLFPDDASYEQLAALLQDQVGLLERGDLTLAEALAAYERGVALVRRCGELLDSAQLRISTLSTEAEASIDGETLKDRDDDEDWDASDDDVPF